MNARLEEIIVSVRSRVATQKRNSDLSSLAEQAANARRRLDRFRLEKALRRTDGMNVIAEFKRASPSKGVINDGVDPADVAIAYERGGACGISVLTEPDHFLGSLDDLRAVRNAVSIPVLRKDFTVDEFQIYEAAISGADSILLIVAALSFDELERFYSLADELGLDAIVEVHTDEEMAVANELKPKIVGVNNRDLKTFDVSLDVSRKLIRDLRSGAVMIAESGFRRREELVELKSLGYSGFLIGEALMRDADAELALKRLRGVDDEG